MVMKSGYKVGYLYLSVAAAFFAAITLFWAPSVFGEINLFNPNPRAFGSSLEFHIDDNGRVSVHGIQVIQKAGTTIYGRLNFGSAIIRLTISTSQNTKFVKRFGGAITIAEINPGDFLSVEGTILQGTDSLGVVASFVKDWSLGTEVREFNNGVVLAVDEANHSLVVRAETKEEITVRVPTTIDIVKGARVIGFAELAVGDKVSRVAGTLDVLQKTLTATDLEIFQDPSVFWPRNFQGTLKSLSSLSLPTVMTLTIDGRDYTVYVPADAVILNRLRQKTTLNRFVVGDTIRFYGAIRQTDLNVADAKVVRNIEI
jgi:hypothetical protein